LDALSIAVAYWVDSMARDDRIAHEEWKREEFDKEIRSFVDNILDHQAPDRSPKWALLS